MFRENRLAIPADVAVLILLRVDLKSLYIFMKLSKACRDLVMNETVWKNNYTYYRLRNNAPLGSWYLQFKNDHCRPSKQFMCDFLQLYRTFNEMTFTLTTRLQNLEAIIMTCKSFDDWFELVRGIRKEYTLFSSTEDSMTIRDVCYALAKYIVDHIARTSDWYFKTVAVQNELDALIAIERLDLAANRHDMLTRFTRRSELMQLRALLRRNSRFEVLGCKEVYEEHFQEGLGVDFEEFKRMSEKRQWGAPVPKLKQTL